MSSGNGYFIVKEKKKTNKVKGMKNCWQCNKLFTIFQKNFNWKDVEQKMKLEPCNTNKQIIS